MLCLNKAISPNLVGRFPLLLHFDCSAAQLLHLALPIALLQGLNCRQADCEDDVCNHDDHDAMADLLAVFGDNLRVR